MPLDITLEKIEAQLIRFIDEYRMDVGLILLVDMGSLNQLGNVLINHLNGPLLLFDHVNTPLLLDIGQHILNDKSIIEIEEKIEATQSLQKQLL